MTRIAWFISPHGYGHAARAAALMETLTELDPTLVFDIFTRVPGWFFKGSLSVNFAHHDLLTDIGLVQRNPLDVNLLETARALDRFFPLDRNWIRPPARVLTERTCRLVICDIAPMGIRVAKEAGIPSVLVENFTWDWIYEGYVKENGALKRHIRYLKALFREADYHIRTQPVCGRDRADLHTAPVSRRAKTPGQDTRKHLRIRKEAKVVLITLGGIRTNYPFLKRLQGAPEVTFIIPGGSDEAQVQGNLVLLPHHSRYLHPDLVRASDAVIGKVGYSTLAECYEAGVPFGYIERPGFRESPELVSFIETHMKGLPIGEEAFYSGTWLFRLPDLLDLPRSDRTGPRGADQAARFILDLL